MGLVVGVIKFCRFVMMGRCGAVNELGLHKRREIMNKLSSFHV